MTRSPAGWHFALAAISLGLAVHLGGGGPHPISFVLLGFAIIVAAVPVLAPGLARSWTTVEGLLLFGVTAQFAVLLVFPIGLYLQAASAYSPWYTGGVALAMGWCLWVLTGRRRSSIPRLVPVFAVHFALGAWVIANSPNPLIDVWHFQQEGVDALLSGMNPYRPIYQDVYGGTSPYYGPGIIEDGRLTVGLPYPPLSLLLAVPGKVLAGDHRYAQLIATELAALCIVLIAPGRVAFGASVLLLFMPRTHLVIERGWTEPFGVMLLAGVVLAATRAPRFTGVAVGALIAVKQYLLLGLPLAIWLLRRAWPDRWRLGLTALGVAAIITIPFVVWGPAEFWRSTVEFLALQPFRPDSLTFLALLPVDLSSVRTLVGFVPLVLAGIVVVFRTDATPAMYAGSLAFLLLVFFAFGKQGALNYYFLVIGCLAVAVAASSTRVVLTDG